MLGSLILYLKGMRTIMFQLSGFYYRRAVRVVQGFCHEGFVRALQGWLQSSRSLIPRL